MKIYKKTKKEFYEVQRNTIKNLKDKKQNAFVTNETNILKEMVKTVQPFIEKINIYKKQELSDGHIKPYSKDKLNVDERHFYIYFEYKNVKYEYKVDCFEYKEVMELWNTYEYFHIQPYFTIKEDTKDGYISILLGFNITHLGINKSYKYQIKDLQKTDDLLLYKSILKNTKRYQKIEQFILQEKINIIKNKKETLLKKTKGGIKHISDKQRGKKGIEDKKMKQELKPYDMEKKRNRGCTKEKRS